MHHKSYGRLVCGNINDRALSTLKGRCGQSASRILGVNPVVVLFNALGTSGFARRSRATVQHFFVFFVAFRECRRDVPTHAPVKAIARSSRYTRPCVALWSLRIDQRRATLGWVCLAAQSRQPATPIYCSDIGSDRLERSKCPALCLDLANDVFTNRLPHVASGPAKPLPLLLKQVCCHTLGLQSQILLVNSGLFKLSNGFVDLVAFYTRASLEPVGC
jgi:hypothetical protein